MTGNTHRAEICIDKLYSPDGPTGRLGSGRIARLRDATPCAHEHGAGAVVRCLISRFWETPYARQPGPLGHATCTTGSCCRTIVWQDMLDVVADLQRAGMPFRCALAGCLLGVPVSGIWHAVTIGDITSRADAPPSNRGMCWARKCSASGMSRYVDSSVERLQLKVSGLTDETLRGHLQWPRAALRRPAHRGEYVVGVRYRAWDPPSALHPDLGSTPRWCSTSSIPGTSCHRRLHLPCRAPRRPSLRYLPGQCPRGRVPPHQPFPRRWPHSRYAAAAPVTDELRRHVIVDPPRGPMAPPPEEVNSEYPCTLDLRVPTGCS